MVAKAGGEMRRQLRCEGVREGEEGNGPTGKKREGVRGGCGGRGRGDPAPGGS